MRRHPVLAHLDFSGSRVDIPSDRIALITKLPKLHSLRRLELLHNGWSPDPPMVGIRFPIGLVVGSCTSHPGVLGSIPKREEPGKTGAPCVKVQGSSRVPAPPWVDSRSPDGWDQIPRWACGWVLHQPPWSSGFDSQTREPAPPWVGSRSSDGWDQIPQWAGGWVLHQPPWSEMMLFIGT